MHPYSVQYHVSDVQETPLMTQMHAGGQKETESTGGIFIAATINPITHYV